MSLISSIPNELIVRVLEYTDSKTKRQFSIVESRIYKLALSTVKNIRVFPGRKFSSSSYSSKVPENILVNVIGQYGNLEKVTFGPPKNVSGCGEFQSKEVPYLKSVITHLQSNPHKNCLSSVKKIEYREVVYSSKESPDELTALKLNKKFLESINSKNLEKVKIVVEPHTSELEGTVIQPVLEKPFNLKTFVFDGFCSGEKKVDLSFVNQLQLTKVKLLNWRGRSSTIESLSKCEELEELVIDYRRNSAKKIISVLLGNHSWKLKRLELRMGVPIHEDEELNSLTKKLPNLECLKVELMNISDNGMETLGKNCPKLKILQFSNGSVTNSGLDKLTQHLPHLELISFEARGSVITEGLAAIARHCKKLRCIEIIGYNKIEKSGIEALIAHCPDLKIVRFEYGQFTLLKDVLYLLEKMPQLRYVEFGSLTKGDAQQEDIDAYRQRISTLSKIPYTRSIKKLYELTV
jgi:hypothetical protein